MSITITQKNKTTYLSCLILICNKTYYQYNGDHRISCEFEFTRNKTLKREIIKGTSGYNFLCMLNFHIKDMNYKINVIYFILIKILYLTYIKILLRVIITSNK